MTYEEFNGVPDNDRMCEPEEPETKHVGIDPEDQLQEDALRQDERMWDALEKAQTAINDLRPHIHNAMHTELEAAKTILDDLCIYRSQLYAIQKERINEHINAYKRKD